LQLAGRVRRIEWRLTGSEFESLLLQFELLQKVYGAKSLERMHLRARPLSASWAAIPIRASW
jgi:excinuclease ABC subunit C